MNKATLQCLIAVSNICRKCNVSTKRYDYLVSIHFTRFNNALILFLQRIRQRL